MASSGNVNPPTPTIGGINQKDAFKGDSHPVFCITGTNLDSVTDSSRVHLCTCHQLIVDGGAKKKLVWGRVEIQGQPTSTRLTVKAHLKSADPSTKPIGVLLGFFVWLWALIHRLWPRDSTGDLTITITDGQGDVLVTKTVSTTYQS